MKATIVGIKIKYLFWLVDLFLLPIKYCSILVFLITRKPYGCGYEFYKWRKIEKEILKIKKKRFFINFKNSSGLDERLVEYCWVIFELKSIKGNLLDAGSTLNFPIILNKLKKNFNIFIQTLFPENICNYEDRISYLYQDLTKKNFANNYFDVIVCISTLEHVGFDISIYNTSNNLKKKSKVSKNLYLNVVKDFKRILKKKGVLLLSVPFGKKELFPELQQFDEKMLKGIIKTFRPKKFEKKFAIYKNFSWQECSEMDCKNIRFQKYSKDKSFDNAASARAIAMLKLVK